MKIAILSPIGRSGTPEHGGIETVVRNLANEFVRQGHGVDLLVYPPPGREPTVGVVDPSVNIERLHAQHKRTLAKALLRYCRRRHPDVILAASHRANMVAGRARRQLRQAVKVYVSEHNTVSAGIKDDGPLKRWHRLHQIRSAYGRADGVVAVSRGVAEDLHERVGIDPTLIRVIYNPIVTDEMERLAAQGLDHPWFAPGQPPVVLGVGRLAPQKDFATLIRAFAQLRRNRTCRLVILGEGKERQRLEALTHTLGVTGDVDMPGFAANPFPYMRHAAVLALSSAFEGFANVVAEALAVGTPVAATDCPHGPREILEDGRYGALSPVGDPHALAHGMQTMMSSPPDEALLRARAKTFSSAAIAQCYLSLFAGREESAPAACSRPGGSTAMMRPRPHRPKP